MLNVYACTVLAQPTPAIQVVASFHSGCQRSLSLSLPRAACLAPCPCSISPLPPSHIVYTRGIHGDSLLYNHVHMAPYSYNVLSVGSIFRLFASHLRLF